MEWQNKSIALFVVTVVMLALPVIIVPVRCGMRVARRAFKLDDWLIVAALLFHVGACAVTIWGFTYGLAMPDEYLTADQKMKAVQTFAMYKPLYTLATCLIKCSICFTMLRLAQDPKIRKALYWIIAIVSGSSLVMFIGSFVYCVPYQAIWTHWMHPHTPGYCLPGPVVLTVGYSFACITIVTDLSCAIIPGIILWNSMMPTNTMCAAWASLSLGVLAGIMTACRLPYIAYWTHKTNQSYGLGRILLFELLECGLGIFASCAPALKPLLHKSKSSISSLLGRFSRWTTLKSQSDGSHLEKGEASSSSRPQSTPVAVPRMDLVIPDIEDTVMDSVLDGEDKDEAVKKVPVVVVTRARPESGDYTQRWDVQRE